MKKFLSIIGGIICSIVCVFLFIVQVGFITFTSVKTLIAKDSIGQIVKQIDFKEVMSSNPSTTSNVYGAFDALGFSIDETDKILASDAFKNFLDEYLYNNIDNIVNDKDISVSYDSVVKLVDDIEAETNITFENKEKFLKLFQEKYPEIEKSINISNTIKSELGEETLQMIKAFLNNAIIIAFVVVFVITYFIMCLLRLSVYKPLIWYGITTIISSFLMLQFFLGMNSIINIIVERANEFKFIIMPVLNVIKNKGLIISLIMLSIGIIMVVVYYFVNKQVKEDEKNENFEQLENDQPESSQTL